MTLLGLTPSRWVINACKNNRKKRKGGGRLQQLVTQTYFTHDDERHDTDQIEIHPEVGVRTSRPSTQGTVKHIKWATTSRDTRSNLALVRLGLHDIIGVWLVNSSIVVATIRVIV